MQFYKYHGTGNDFIIFDNRDNTIKLSTDNIAGLCHRRFGIGADGLMLLEQAPGFDFKMVYFNSDGNESSMCGNGGRCITAFAKRLNIINNSASFIAKDGVHNAILENTGNIKLWMQDVLDISNRANYTLLNTGSPHYVTKVNDLAAFNVFIEGRKIRNSLDFMEKGVNVNFVQYIDDVLFVRTYERGVEDETLSCGTGVVASAIAVTEGKTGNFSTLIETKGGKLEVCFTKPNPYSANNVVLIGPATFVFEGSIEI